MLKLDIFAFFFLGVADAAAMYGMYIIWFYCTYRSADTWFYTNVKCVSAFFHRHFVYSFMSYMHLHMQILLQ